MLFVAMGEARADWSDYCPSGTTAGSTCKKCGTTCAYTQNGGDVTLYGSGTVGGSSSSDSPFYNNASITSVTADTSSNFTSIGKQAFMDASSLQSVKLPNVTTIGDNAFKESSLQSVDLPNATSIGAGAFAYMSSLQSVDLPNATIIGNSAFYDSTLKDIIISDQINSDKLHGNAFKHLAAGAKITCLGDINTCDQKLAKFYTSNDCPSGLTCNCTSSCISPSRVQSASETQCNNSASYYYTGSECTKRPQEGTDITCEHTYSGYVKVGNYCISPENSYAKKHYTPAEANQWLRDGNDNAITITFKK